MRPTILLSMVFLAASSFFAAAQTPPDTPPFKPPSDIQHPRTPDEPPGAPEKTTGTVQSYEPGKSLVLTTADGSRSYDLTHARLAGDTELAVGDQITVIKTIDSRGAVTLTIARESGSE